MRERRGKDTVRGRRRGQSTWTCAGGGGDGEGDNHLHDAVDLLRLSGQLEEREEVAQRAVERAAAEGEQRRKVAQRLLVEVVGAAEPHADLVGREALLGEEPAREHVLVARARAAAARVAALGGAREGGGGGGVQARVWHERGGVETRWCGIDQMWNHMDVRLSGWGGEGEGRGRGAIITSDPVSHLMHALGSWLKRWRAPFGIVGALMSSDT